MAIETLENLEALSLLAHIRAVWEIRARRAFYYHGTQESKLQSILKEGLKPNCLTGNVNYGLSTPEAVYLTEEPEEAKNWAIWNRKTRNMAIEKWTLKAAKNGNLTLISHRFERAFVICVPKARVDRNKLVHDHVLCWSPSFEFLGTIEPPFSFYEVFHEGEQSLARIRAEQQKEYRIWIQNRHRSTK